MAWHPLGWTPSFFSEIAHFPRAILKHHYKDVPLHGDFTTIKEGDYASIDLLVGGTPCQSFSIAGLRGGVEDERGNLALEYLRLADRLRPRWLVWENVPGVLSSAGGRDFGSIIGGMGELGYGWAYRSLDAQYFGLAQRRKRIFLVGYFGDWRPAAAVFFEPSSMSGHPPPSRKTREGVAGTIGASTGVSRGVQDAAGGHMIPVPASQSCEVSMSLNAHGGSGRMDGESETFVTGTLNSSVGRGTGGAHETSFLNVTHSLRASGGSEDGTGRGTPLVAFTQNQRDEIRELSVAGALSAQPEMHQQTFVNTHAVRRLTPRECERLMGFSDNFTLIPYRGKPAADGPRYRALGNSMAVPVMAWIGQRIGKIDRHLAAVGGLHGASSTARTIAPFQRRPPREARRAPVVDLLDTNGEL